MPRRIQPFQNPVTIEHDGAPLRAERGEPLACALIGQNRLLVSRSPKLHRPRAPSCLRGACDGCLARVNGVPNVMTCRVPALGGEQVETQNVLGSRTLDLMRATDFLFPHGIDHHRLFAGVSGVSAVVQALARRAAGLGELPSQPRAASSAQRERVPVLVVGGGAAGLAAAATLGKDAWLVEDGAALGGSLALLEPARGAALVRAATASGARLTTRSTALGLFHENSTGQGLRALVVQPERATLVVPERVIVATGTHDAGFVFDNNDLPGIWPARAALELLRRGILVGERIVVAGDGRFAAALCSALDALEPERRPALRRIDVKTLVRAAGSSQVSGLVYRVEQGERRLRCDALVLDAPGTPSIELVTQAGGTSHFDLTRGYVPAVGADGLVAPNVYCAGSAAAATLGSEADGARIAKALI